MHIDSCVYVYTYVYTSISVMDEHGCFVLNEYRRHRVCTRTHIYMQVHADTCTKEQCK